MATRNDRAKRKRAEGERIASGEQVPRCRECGAIGFRATPADVLTFDHEESCGVRMAQERQKRYQSGGPNHILREEVGGGVPIVLMIRGDTVAGRRPRGWDHGEGTDKALAARGTLRD
jgi:hypothetical protein